MTTPTQPEAYLIVWTMLTHDGIESPIMVAIDNPEYEWTTEWASWGE